MVLQKQALSNVEPGSSLNVKPYDKTFKTTCVLYWLWYHGRLLSVVLHLQTTGLPFVR